MFNKKDYTKYFLEIKKIEASMRESVESLEGMSKDKEIINRLEIIKKDEIKHEKIVEAILKLIV